MNLRLGANVNLSSFDISVVKLLVDVKQCGSPSFLLLFCLFLFTMCYSGTPKVAGGGQSVSSNAGTAIRPENSEGLTFVALPFTALCRVCVCSAVFNPLQVFFFFLSVYSVVFLSDAEHSTVRPSR